MVMVHDSVDLSRSVFRLGKNGTWDQDKGGRG